VPNRKNKILGFIHLKSKGTLGRWLRSNPVSYSPGFRSQNAGRRLLIVGVGQMGFKHAIILSALGYELRGVFDVSRERMEMVKGINPRVRCLGSMDEINAQDYDLAVVATLADSHAPILRQLLNFGINKILCEKPAANTMRDTTQIRQMGTTAGASICFNHLRRWSPDYHAIKEKISGGSIGRLRSVTCCIKSGGFGNIGSHYIDLILYLTGERIKTARARMDTNLVSGRGDSYQDPNGVAFFGLSNGATFSLDSLNYGRDKHPDASLNIEFERGAVTVWESRGVWYYEDRPAGLRERHEFSIPLNTSFLGGSERAKLLDAALSDVLGQPGNANLSDGCHAAEAIIAAQLASVKGIQVELPLDESTAPIYRFS
jgi:predicted dehydrogenase